MSEFEKIAAFASWCIEEYSAFGDGVEILAVPSLLIDDEKMRKNDDAVEQIRRFVGATNDSI